MEKVNVSEFKATCLRLLERVRQTGEPLEILKNGQLLATVHPPATQSRKGKFGCMRHTVRGKVGDLITPLEDQNWEVLGS